MSFFLDKIVNFADDNCAYVIENDISTEILGIRFLIGSELVSIKLDGLLEGRFTSMELNLRTSGNTST